LTSLSGVFVAGAVFAVQVEPLDVAMISGDLPTTFPTAKQCVVLAHETPPSATVADDGGVCFAQLEPPLVVATINGAPLEVFPTTMQSLSSAQLIALYCPVALLGGICVLHVGLVAAAFALWMIVPAEVVPPTAKQWLASGHDRP
jgi:hypothetical protein